MKLKCPACGKIVERDEMTWPTTEEDKVTDRKSIYDVLKERHSKILRGSMKQKVKITREQILNAITVDDPEKVTLELHKLFTRMCTTFPDSIEVEVDVPDDEDWGKRSNEEWVKIHDELTAKEQPYKLMAPAIIESRGFFRPSIEWYESEDSAKKDLGVYFVSWPARIDPATGMYKVPVRGDK